MSAVHRLLAALLASIALAGCGGDSEPPAPPQEAKETVFDDMLDAKEKARAVEDTTLQHKEDIDRALEESSR